MCVCVCLWFCFVLILLYTIMKQTPQTSQCRLRSPYSTKCLLKLSHQDCFNFRLEEEDSSSAVFVLISVNEPFWGKFSKARYLERIKWWSLFLSCNAYLILLIYFYCFSFTSAFFLHISIWNVFAYAVRHRVSNWLFLKFPGWMPSSLAACQSQSDDWSWQHRHLITASDFTRETKWDRRCKKACKAMKERVHLMWMLAKKCLTNHFSVFIYPLLSQAVVAHVCWCDLRGGGKVNPPLQVTSDTDNPTLCIVCFRHPLDLVCQKIFILGRWQFQLSRNRDGHFAIGVVSSWCNDSYFLYKET